MTRVGGCWFFSLFRQVQLFQQQTSSILCFLLVYFCFCIIKLMGKDFLFAYSHFTINTIDCWIEAIAIISSIYNNCGPLKIQIRISLRCMWKSFKCQPKIVIRMDAIWFGCKLCSHVLANLPLGLLINCS